MPEFFETIINWFASGGTFIQMILVNVLDVVQSVDPALRMLIAGLAMMLETSAFVGLVVPGDTIVIVTATSVDSFFSGLLLVAVIIIGALIGESIGFALGRWIGPSLKTSWVGRKIGEKNWQRAELYLQRRGGIAIFISRFLPVLHSLVPLTVGMSTYSYRKFILWTFPACLLWAGTYVTIAALAAGTFREQIAKQAHLAGYIFVGTILLFLLVVWVIKKVLSRTEKRHLEPASDSEPEIRSSTQEIM